MTLDPKPRDRDSRGPGLALVGYRGTGKTTVGKILADRLDLRFLDADLEIEARAGRSIVSIFAESGEPVFRDWEEHTLRELVEHHPEAVLASGGGAVLRPANCRLLLDFGFVVWLRADPAELARRLEADLQAGTERPALTAPARLPRSPRFSAPVLRSTRKWPMLPSKLSTARPSKSPR